MTTDLCFISYDSVVDTAFWHALSQKKLEEFRLNEGPFPTTAEFTNGTPLDTAPRMSLDFESLNGTNSLTRNNLFRANGYLYAINTMDKFKLMDKQAHIDEFGRRIICEQAIEDKITFLNEPNKLLAFSLLVFCDLKYHKFYYWFAFPAVVQKHKPKLLKKERICNEIDPKAMETFPSNYDAWRANSSDVFFCIESYSTGITILPLASYSMDCDNHYIGFCDPSSHDEFPGWALRNLLFAFSNTVQEDRTIKVVCWRDRYTNQQRTFSHSLVLHIRIAPEVSSSDVKFVGWEKWNGKLQPRVVNLSSTMNPVKLAESAVDLNLKLMLWRMLPNLDLGVIRKARCLILGSGTLGCNVARQLLAWGFVKMTFVDNGKVSYSNPVRQTLFTFEDAKSGAPKATAAAEAIKRIFPGAESASQVLTIPMPGHPVSNASAGVHADTLVASVRESCLKLEELIKDHDVVFLLLDTREARWLPTLLATFHRKIAITAALGFDSFLVMRHGLSRTAGQSPSFASAAGNTRDLGGDRLGCYFCNDVVGPANSTRDITLDQQCTVSRPGTSMMASALAVELCVGLLQHADGAWAPTESRSMGDGPTSQISTFGFLPHQIRGFLPQFSEVCPCTAAFSRCSACSQPVLDAFGKEGFDFLVKVFDDAAYLELVSGLQELKLGTDLDEVLSWTDDDGEPDE